MSWRKRWRSFCAERADKTPRGAEGVTGIEALGEKSLHYGVFGIIIA